MQYQENAPEKKQSLAVPIAIIVAGILVGAGIYLSGKGTSAPLAALPGAAKQEVSDISIKPLSAKDHVTGAQNAAVTLVEYSDLECPFCKTFHQTLQQLMTAYSSKVAWAFRPFPIAELHPKAPKEAQAAECAADQGKFWEFTNKIFDITPSNNGLDPALLSATASGLNLDMTTFNNCLGSTAHVADVSQSVSDAEAAGANGTPTSFLLLSSALSEKSVQDMQVMTASFKLPDGTPLVSVSKDRKTISLVGALPYDVVKGIMDIALGSR